MPRSVRGCNRPQLLVTVLALAGLPMASRAAVAVSIDIAPPPLPVCVQPVMPAPGYLWTPDYWGNRIGFHGGVNYGFSNGGHGYAGGDWQGGVFNDNRSVNNVNTTIVHNGYNTTVVENHTRVSFNGGQGDIAARPSREEREARAEQHTPPTAQQHQHEQVARRRDARRRWRTSGRRRRAAAWR